MGIRHGFLSPEPMKKNKKLSAKLFITLVSGISLVIVAALYLEFRLSKRYISYQTQSLEVNNIRYRMLEINDELKTFKTLSQNVAVLISSVKMDSLQINQLQQLIFGLSEEIHGVGIFISGDAEKSSVYNQYCYRENDSVILTHTLPFDTDRLKPGQIGAGPTQVKSRKNQTLYVFYSMIHPELNTSNLLFTIDFSPGFIQSSLEKNTNSNDIEYIILDNTEHLLFQNLKSTHQHEEAQNSWEEKLHPKFSLIRNQSDSISETFIPSKDYNRKESIYILPLPNMGWNCLFFIPEKKLDKTLVRHFLLVSILSVLAILITAILISYYARKITGPLSLISRAIKDLENGNLYNEMPDIDTEDELEDIANSFQKVQSKMQHYASGFKSSLEEKRSMSHDLRMASQIQESMLPDQFQGLIDFPEINLFTRLVPAKGVAGDFFDYCFLDKARFFFIVGDVAGKGIPAALYMVKVLTLLRTQKIRSMPLHKMFTEISNELAGVNTDGNFVTAIGGILNFQTGELILCDAGHNPPFISKNGRKFHHIQVNKNVPLGVVTDHTYIDTRLQLKRKDAIFLYTDGLPEAADSKGHLFENERIAQSLANNQNKKLEVIFNHLKNALLNFVGKAKQADDITIFLLRYMKS